MPPSPLQPSYSKADLSYRPPTDCASSIASNATLTSKSRMPLLYAPAIIDVTGEPVMTSESLPATGPRGSSPPSLYICSCELTKFESTSG